MKTALEELMAVEEQPKTTEIVPGLTSEEMVSTFFDCDALREPPYKLYQLNGEGHRYYYRYNNDGDPEFYPSVTTLLKQVMPTSPFLIEWMIKNGAEGSTEKRDMAAAYGTFMHAQFEEMIIARKYDFDSVPGKLITYIERNNLPDRFFSENLMKIRKDVCAFAQFVKDYKVRALAVEIALVHPEHHYAGMLDLPCIMTDPKTKEEFPAIVDFKSGRKGFYEDHELQLHLYKEMWNVNFPELPIERVFNFAPKDWRGVKPTYTLKEQTNAPSAAKIPYLIQLASIEDAKKDNIMTVISGVMELDDYEPSKNIVSLSLSELIKSRQSEDLSQAKGVEIDAMPEETSVFEPKSEKGVNVPPQQEKALKQEKSNLFGLLDSENDFEF